MYRLQPERHAHSLVEGLTGLVRMVTVPSVVRVVHSRFLCTDAGSDLSQLTLLAPQALVGSRVASRAVDSEFVSKHGVSSILVVCRHTKQTITTTTITTTTTTTTRRLTQACPLFFCASPVKVWTPAGSLQEVLLSDEESDGSAPCCGMSG